MGRCSEVKPIVLLCVALETLGSSTGERRILSDQWNLCACKHEVSSCVSLGAGNTEIRKDRTNERKQPRLIIGWSSELRGIS